MNAPVIAAPDGAAAAPPDTAVASSPPENYESRSCAGQCSSGRVQPARCPSSHGIDLLQIQAPEITQP